MTEHIHDRAWQKLKQKEADDGVAWKARQAASPELKGQAISDFSEASIGGALAYLAANTDGTAGKVE